MSTTATPTKTTTTRKPRGAAAKAAATKKTAPAPKSVTELLVVPTEKKITAKKVAVKKVAEPKPAKPEFLTIDTSDKTVKATIASVHDRLNKRLAVPNSQVRILVAALEDAKGLARTPQR